MAHTADDHAARVARAGRRTHHRIVALSLKTTLAAGIAWQLGVMLPSYLPTYSFYAPLGAVTVMYSALYDSAVEGLRAIGAVALGVLVSLLLHLAHGPNAVTVALAVGIGMVLGNIRVLGSQGSWVPLAALFVFTAGRADPPQYIAGYLSQLTLGAVVGFVVNSVVFPPLALHEVERATRAVRRDIVSVLGALVRMLEADDDAVEERSEDVARTLVGLPDTRQRLRTATSQAERARHGNPRRKRWSGSHADLLALAAASGRAASVVEDLAREMYEEREVLSRSERARLAAAITSLRDVMAQSRDGVADGDMVRRTDELLDDVVLDGSPFVIQRATGALRRSLRILTNLEQ